MTKPPANGNIVAEKPLSLSSVTREFASFLDGFMALMRTRNKATDGSTGGTTLGLEACFGSVGEGDGFKTGIGFDTFTGSGVTVVAGGSTGVGSEPVSKESVFFVVSTVMSSSSGDVDVVSGSEATGSSADLVLAAFSDVMSSITSFGTLGCSMG